jgi:hypothetical protein
MAAAARELGPLGRRHAPRSFAGRAHVGMDTAVIIATTTNVSLPLVLAAQLVRLIMVMIAAPSMAKVAADWQRPAPPFQRTRPRALEATARSPNTSR